MNRIAILDASLADKIAAGEVVERPASVVKELVENSIDAKATRIDIFAVGGGKTLIEVKDNGYGMSLNDAKLSLKRHATSKIKNDFDLGYIKTMGFRGEALSAISSVSKFTMKTCEKDAIGTELFCLNSEIIDVKNCAMPQGTIIKVEELFYNTPARLKYLKSESSELSAIIDIVSKLALANPDIAFSLRDENKDYIKTSGNGDCLAVIGEVFGLNVAKNMLYFKNSNYDFTIEGYTTNISISKPNRYSIYSFMNNRYIKNKITADCVIEGYKEFLFENRYPITIIYISSDPSILDVNVHPTKQDIRISKEGELKTLISSTINETLKNKNKVTSFVKEKVDIDLPKQQFFDMSLQEENTTYENTQILTSEDKINGNAYFPIGQIAKTYIVAEGNEGFILIDQHAAAERIRYERYLKIFQENYYSIDLLVPEIIELPKDEFNEISKHLDMLKEAKIEAELFGDNALKVTHVPYYFEKVDVKVYIDSIISEIITNKKITLSEFRRYAIATLACKASLKANHTLSLNDMEILIADLFKCENPYTCPHGRPTMLKYSYYDLKKAFKRV